VVGRLIDELPNEVGSDKTSTASDEDFHEWRIVSEGF
jgi:hypothetical protein